MRLRKQTWPTLQVFSLITLKQKMYQINIELVGGLHQLLLCVFLSQILPNKLYISNVKNMLLHSQNLHRCLAGWGQHPLWMTCFLKCSVQQDTGNSLPSPFTNGLPGLVTFIFSSYLFHNKQQFNAQMGIATVLIKNLFSIRHGSSWKEPLLRS